MEKQVVVLKKESWTIAGVGNLWHTGDNPAGVSVLTRIKNGFQIASGFICDGFPHIDLELCELHGFTRRDQTLLFAFQESESYQNNGNFSEGRKSFEMCTNSSSKPATPARFLECLVLTKQDLADFTCWCWTY
ncbi:hypothetical protein TNCV_4508961 [Trichonephila clavipes]|nr:hypothetical protein TNCV_4508961 [Trichonephila clavipes]